jgi:hypothetical protein
VGANLFVQGMMVDPAPGAALQVGLTNAMRIEIGAW